MRALTVFLAPAGAADGVLSALTDLSAAKLIEPFYWVTNPTDVSPPSTMVQVVAGRQIDVTVQQIVSSQRADITRVCALVPLTGTDVPLTLAQERFTTDLLASTSGVGRTVRVRCLLARPGAPQATGSRAAIDGWHNILVNPEDGRGPRMGHVQLAGDSSAESIGRHAAPVIAALLGLWSEIDHRPLDDASVPPGEVVRLARSFYRKVETGDAEAGLRRRLLAQDGTLPLPSDQRSPVVYVHDVGLAAANMSDSLWRKHAGILKGPRREYATHTTEKIGAWKALKMFFGFMWAAIKNAPSAWYQAVVEGVSTSIAASVNKAVFGSDSEYEVVVNGRTARGERAEWGDIAQATSRLNDVLESGDRGDHNVRTDLSGVWQDYSRAAMTIADAGVRASDLPPVQVGANRGILAYAASVVPGPAQRFTAIPGAVAASVNTDGVDSTDPLGVLSLRNKLNDLERTPEHGLQARSTLNALDAWQRENSQSFGVTVGRRLADAFADAYGEVRQLLQQLRDAGDLPPEPGRNTRLARWIQVTVLLLIVVTAAVAFLAYKDKLEWWWAVVIALVAYLLGIGLCANAFWRSQQELFQLLNKRRAMIDRREVDHQNLRAALRDLNRLSQAYGEFLSWSRALGAFFAAPLGPDTYRPDVDLRIGWGLPMSTAIAYASPADTDVDGAVGYLRRELFNVSWLSGPWENLVLSTQPGATNGREITADSAAVWTQPGRGSGSTLDRWSDELFAGTRTSDGADVVWDRAQSALHGPLAGLVDTLVNRVDVPGGAPMSRPEFLAEVDQPAPVPAAGAFDRSLLTDLAATSNASAVVDDVRHRVADGIGTICVATQFSEAMPLDYLAVGAVGAYREQGWQGAIPAAGFDGRALSNPASEGSGEFRPPDLGGGFRA